MRSRASDKQVNNLKGKGQPHRWKQGESGNPNGRPRKDHSITSLLKQQIQESPKLITPKGEVDPRTWQELLVEAMLIGARKSAMEGKVALVQEILDRVEGKVPQPMTQAIHGEVTLRVVEDR